MHKSNQPIDQHNYYRSGIDRVIGQLRQIDASVPDAALRRVPTMPEEILSVSGLPESPAFSPLDHAIMNRFEGRDYLLAQQLLHPTKIGSNEWHAIGFPDPETPSPTLDFVLSPSLLDATAVAISHCDKSGTRIDAVESDGTKVVFWASKTVAASICPIDFEPFSLQKRDRVRFAFKHVRNHSNPELLHARLKKIPGFENTGFSVPFYERTPRDGCLLFGYPSNWAAEMKNALEDVEIAVKLHQAQDLVATFFGAASWHQLISHQDDEMRVLVPTCVSWGDEKGRQHRYFKTAEEAIYAVGQIIGASHEDIVVDHLSLTLSNYPATLSCAKKNDFEAADGHDRYLLTHCIESGWNDVESAADCSDGVVVTAERLLRAITNKKGNPAEVLCSKGGARGQFFAAQKRAGVSEENIVPVGDYFLSFEMANEPGERDFLFIHRIEGNAITKVADGIPLYKASLVLSPGAQSLTIKTDYQRVTVATIPVVDARFIDTVRDITQRSIGRPVLEVIPYDIRFH